MGGAVRRLKGVEAFHIVDLVAEIGRQQDFAVDDGAGLDLGAPMRRMRMPMPSAMLKRRSSSSRSPFGRKAPSVGSKSSLRTTEKRPFQRPVEDAPSDDCRHVEALVPRR